MKRVLSVWLPHLAIERWAKSSDCPPDSPIVLTLEGTHGPIIHALTKAAAERGARAGARLTDARALDPDLIAFPADPDGDSVLMQKLARWTGRWSPLVEVDEPDGLLLDVSGVAHLFGGERGLVSDMSIRFARIGLTARIAIAPTSAAAWALARHAPCRCAAAELKGKLDPLHISALRLDPDTIRTLERLGLKTIGDLLAVPRLSLARRFRGAEDVVDALDRALGHKPEPLTSAPIDPPPRAALRLEEPATHPQAAGQALERLIPDLVRQLHERHLGARRLALHAFRVDGSVAIASVSTTIASREPRHFERLLNGKVAALDAEFGFDAFALVADWTEELSAVQESLVEEPSGERELARLIDRLTVKFGPGKVRRPKQYESHLPERASGWVPAVSSSLSHSGREGGRKPSGGKVRRRSLHQVDLGQDPPPQSSSSEPASRPQRLLDGPEPIDVIYASPEGMPRRFVWRRAMHDIARVEGPERIAPEWWRQPSSTRLRDYYRVEDAEGRRYWIYREGVIGDGRGGAPSWFIHGLFG